MSENKKAKYLLTIDTETGGLSPNEHSLLEIGAVLGDAEANVIHEEFNVLVIPDKRATTLFALGLNNLNRLGTNHKAVSEREASVQFVDWILDIKKKYPDTVLLGHSTKFDVDFIDSMLSRHGYLEWDSIFGHRHRDTRQVALFLMDIGAITPEDGSISLGKLLKYFGIKHGGAHTAMGDAKGTYELYLTMMMLIRDELPWTRESDSVVN